MIVNLFNALRGKDPEKKKREMLSLDEGCHCLYDCHDIRLLWMLWEGSEGSLWKKNDKF